MAPQKKRIAMCEIRRGQVRAEREAEAGVFVPIANVRRRDPIGAAKQIEKAAEPAFRVVNRGPASRSLGHRESPRSIALANQPQAFRDVTERLIPADSLPTGIRLTLGPRAHERIVEA